jgi:transglutaminase-like putative cysteine protease
VPPAITVSSDVEWSTDSAAVAVLLLRVAHCPGQRVTAEDLRVEGAEVEDPGTVRDLGARPLRLRAGGGPVVVRYRATVELDAPAAVDPAAPLGDLGEYRLEQVSWTLPSRYCPSDVLEPTARALFGDLPRTGALLEAVRSWVESEIEYTPGVSDAHTGAESTLLARAGVCRDLAHLATALLRAMGVPARMVAAYAKDLEPQDFHALVEAHDGIGWRLLDATGLAPTETTARIATGRDATDIAWATTEGAWELQQLTIDVAAA